MHSIAYLRYQQKSRLPVFCLLKRPRLHGGQYRQTKAWFTDLTNYQNYLKGHPVMYAPSPSTDIFHFAFSSHGTVVKVRNHCDGNRTFVPFPSPGRPFSFSFCPFLPYSKPQYYPMTIACLKKEFLLKRFSLSLGKGKHFLKPQFCNNLLWLTSLSVLSTMGLVDVKYNIGPF